MVAGRRGQAKREKKFLKQLRNKKMGEMDPWILICGYLNSVC
jgi:hypothetical protein